MKGLPASTGLQWLKQGFMLFRQQPGILVMLTFTNLMIMVLLSQVPLLGPIVAYLAIPSFTIAIQQSCRMIDEGQRVQPNVLMTGFRPPSVGPLFKLGSVYLVLFLLLGLVVYQLIDPAWLAEAKKMVEAKKQPVPDRHTVLVLGFSMIAFWLAMTTLSFAPGLTYWKRMPTFKAIFYSVFAVLGSKAPMAVMLISWFGMFSLAQMVLGVLLGATAIGQVVLTWLLFIAVLILHCATYAAYKQILGAPEDGPDLAK